MRARAVWFVLAFPLWAQWDPVLLKNVPLLPDGQPNLTAPAPRTADGKPDLSGVWRAPAEPRTFLPKYMANLAADLPPGAVPLRPAAAVLFEKLAADIGKDLPSSHCLPPGVPISLTVPLPVKIVQTPDVIVTLHEEANLARQIFTDGRRLPHDPVRTWMGYSIGRWDGEVLVVESSGFNARTWLDASGHPHGEALRITERYRRLNVGQLEMEITIDDPEYYERPWAVTILFDLQPNGEMMEYVCLENEKDVVHLVGQ